MARADRSVQSCSMLPYSVTERRRARRRRRTRAGLLEAGRRSIGARGLECVAVAAITDEADVGVGSFHDYFASKRDFLDVVIAEVTALVGDALDRAAHGIHDPAERVVACVRQVVRLAEEDPTWAWFVLRASDAVPRLAASVIAPIERHVRSGMACGRFRVDDPAMTMEDVGDVTLSVMRATLLRRVGAHADRLAAEQVLRLLGLPPMAAHVVAARRLPGDAGAVAIGS